MDKDMYSLNYTQLARDDMLDILMYISEEADAPGSAERVLGIIESDLARLREHPCIAPVARDEYLSSQGFRVLVSGKYLAFCRVNDSERNVTVYCVVHGSRNLKLLFT